MTADELQGLELIYSFEIIEAQADPQENIDDAQGKYELSVEERALLKFDGDAEIGEDWQHGDVMLVLVPNNTRGCVMFLGYNYLVGA